SVGNSMKMYVVIVTTSPYMPAGYPASFSAGGVSFNMYYVPGGLTFKAGTGDSTPTTITNAYWIAKTSVTYELWSTVYNWATSHGYTFANAGRKGNAGTGNVTQPVTVINWRDTMIWMNALTEWYNAKNGTQYTCIYYTDAGYTTPIRTSTNSVTIDMTAGTQDNPYVNNAATGFRMLSSAEWELAARYKGSDSTNGAYEWPVGSGNWWTKGTYASGATASYTNNSATWAVAWDTDNSGAASHDVALLAANALTLYDMSGNVWQWSFDWYTSGSARIDRGGSWGNAASGMQVGFVGSLYPYYAYANIGFRFARTNL
ncbi:MAG: SUMF1/EgtB/PvdO family nonheme iron enzyme, partial [Proteobacteria bacterium]|nr:SUMF1/EgtB/PvdO family nonheme iron enzyme [Pseudomonadota bacterium]